MERKQILFLFLAFLLFSTTSCSDRLIMKEREKEKLIEGHWTNEFNYVDLQFRRGGKENEYKIIWPGSRFDNGTWRIANNGIILESEVEGGELYGDIVELSEDKMRIQFVNREEYELTRVDDKK